MSTSVSFWRSHQNPICIPLLPIRATCLKYFHPPWLDHSNYTWRSLQDMKVLIMLFFPNPWGRTHPFSETLYCPNIRWWASLFPYRCSFWEAYETLNVDAEFLNGKAAGNVSEEGCSERGCLLADRIVNIVTYRARLICTCKPDFPSLCVASPHSPFFTN
jgi:hypothetical protein